MARQGRPRRARPPQATAPAAAERAVRQRIQPYRTPQNPFEVSADDTSELHKVEKIVGMRWSSGERQYQVKWEGYADKDNTWEPLEHLVGCAEQIRDYEKRREQQDKEDREAFLEKRKQAKEKAAAEAAAQRAAAIAASAEEGVPNVINLEGGAEGEEEQISEAKRIAKKHRAKTGAVWQKFDLTKWNPSCKCLMSTGEHIHHLHSSFLSRPSPPPFP